MNPKLLIIGGIITVALLGGGVFLASKPTSTTSATVSKTTQSKFELDHTSFDWGTIDYNKGKISHIFEFKNTGSEPLTVANFKTSCSCTTVRMLQNETSSPYFKMHQQSSWKGIVAPGETARVEIVFDPQFHGPQATGPVERIVSFITSDQNHEYVEFVAKGTVVKL